MEANEAEKAAEAQETEGGVVAERDPKVKSMIKNLRIREDTAKYLYDLGEDLNSGHYDPKSRSLRQHWKYQNDNSTIRADNWHAPGTDYHKLLEQEKFAW